jgi:uncharacterized SAM-binding protein YcdF (DUF218 family)
VATAFFILSKIIGGAIRVESWIVIGLLLALYGLWRGHERLTKWSLGLTLAFVLGLGIFPLGDVLIRPLEQQVAAPELPDRIDGIIVLGGGEDGSLSRFWGQPVVNDAGERFTAAATLARHYPDALVLFTGGSGALSTIGQTVLDPSDMAARLLTDLGVSSDRLRLESASRNTAENARLSHALIAPEPGQQWILVTSAFHMPRAMRSFEAAGWSSIIPYPVDFRSNLFRNGIGWDLPGHMLTLNIALKEYLGLAAYAATGQ